MKTYLSIFLLLVLLLNSGCSSANSKSAKVNVSNHQKQQSIGSGVEDIDSGVSVNESQTSSNISPVDSSESDITSERNENGPQKYEYLYPIESYPQKTPYSGGIYHGVDGIDGLVDFYNETDLEFKGGNYFSCIKLARETGYVLEPYYDGLPLSEKRFGIAFEKNLSGVGYGCSVKFEKVKGRFGIWYLKEEWVDEAREKPFAFEDGKRSAARIEHWEQNDEYKMVDCKIDSKNIIACILPKNYNHLQRLCFNYEDMMILIELDYETEIDICDFAEKLTFQKIPLE